jgi:hypothetical protein
MDLESKIKTGKRKFASDSETESTSPKKFNKQTSLPLFPKAKSSRRQHLLVSPQIWNPHGRKLGPVSVIPQAPTSKEREERSNEEEWKNDADLYPCHGGEDPAHDPHPPAKINDSCQHLNIWTTEQIVDTVQEKAKAAIMDVKQVSLIEVKRAASVVNEEDDEVKGCCKTNLNF